MPSPEDDRPRAVDRGYPSADPAGEAAADPAGGFGRELVSRLLREDFPRLQATLRLPPFEELSVENVAAVLKRRLAGLARRADGGSLEPEGLSRDRLRPVLREVVEQQAAAGWTRISLMLTGRARVQLCLMGVPRRLQSPDDLAQVALARAHERHRQFHGNCEAQYRGWVKSILDRLVIDHGRALRKGQGMERRTYSMDEQCERWSTQDGLKLADSRAVTASEQSRRQESIDRLFEAIERLPVDERNIVVEKMAERTFEEIARDTGIPKTTVVRRYHSALAALRRELEGLA
jgi:RNA polymerase sigma factor (sigma-70 family)